MTPAQIFWMFVSCLAVALLIGAGAWVAVHLRMLNDLDGEDWYQ